MCDQVLTESIAAPTAARAHVLYVVKCCVCGSATYDRARSPETKFSCSECRSARCDNKPEVGVVWRPEATDICPVSAWNPSFEMPEDLGYPLVNVKTSRLVTWSGKRHRRPNVPQFKFTTPVPDIHDRPDLQADFKREFVEWTKVLTDFAAVPENDNKYPFHEPRRRKDGCVIGSCSRCGSELFFQVDRTRWQDIACRDCGHETPIRKGPLPFFQERQELCRVGDDEDGLQDFFSTRNGEILSRGGYGEINTRRVRQEARKELPEWFRNTQKVREVLCHKFPLLRLSVTDLKKESPKIRKEYKGQLEAASCTWDVLYRWDSCFETDQEIAQELSASGESLAAAEVKSLRETFIDSGDRFHVPAKRLKRLARATAALSLQERFRLILEQRRLRH